jgi:diaminopimelate epimerase
MKVNFKKYQGTGNDFVMIDNRTLLFKPDKYELIARLCHRKFGIGADGLILLQYKPGYDFEMVYFNSDGRESTMCGNGGRCIVQFARELGIIDSSCRFWAVDGEHRGNIGVTGIVSLAMQDVSEVERIGNAFILDTGSPHYVQFVKDVSTVKIVEEARKIRYSEQFAAKGINVNMVEAVAENTIKLRTYERGVEDETLSCGTGVVAASIAHFLFYRPSQSEIQAQTLGGNLRVRFQEHKGIFTDIYLEGPAEKVFEGMVELSD